MDTFYFYFFWLPCSVALWGGRDAANKYHSLVIAVFQPRWACPCLRCTPLRLYVAPGSEAGLRLHAPPRSKPNSGSVLR